MEAIKKILIPFYLIVNCLNCLNFVSAQNTPLAASILSDDLYPLGYLDVTALGIDNTGNTDVTNAINDAIIMARDNQLVCYFPSGTYLISNTIEAMLLSYDHDNNPNNSHLSNRRFPCVLEGECNNRPILKLQNNANGFNNASETDSKAAVILWASPVENVFYDGVAYPKGNTNPNGEFPGIAFNQIFRNFVIDLGDNNPGAVGIRFAGAQGSSMENVKIIANGAYAGMQRMMGQASGYYNIEIIGGEYGIQINNSRLSEYAFISGIRFINQTKQVLSGLSWFPITITGFYIENTHGKVFNNHPTTRGGISLIDGVINITGTPTQACFTLYSQRNLYLKNVDIKGNDKIINVANDPVASINTDPNIWTKYLELSYCPDDVQNKSQNLTECNINQQDHEVSIIVDEPTDTTLIFDKHIGPIRDCFDLNNAINVKDSTQMTGMPGPAIGDGTTDDTAALQWALDKNTNVFLPKGEYKISNTLLLKYHTHLRGAGKVFSRIKAASNWNTPDMPMIKTINHKDANTKISNIMIEIDPAENYNLTALHWQAGRNSVVNNIMLGSDGFSNDQTPASSIHYGYKINGNGGGRWYNTCAEWHRIRYTTTHPNYRGFYIENTTEPLAFYSINVERVRTEPQAEIKNASNIDMYYFKAEAGGSSGAGTMQPASIPLLINDSNNLNIYGGTGKVELDSDEAFIEIYNSTNTTINHIKSIKDSLLWNTIKTECNALSSEVNLSNYKSCHNIVYVNENATGENNGFNWADAYTNLQDALNLNNARCDGKTEVWVAEGTSYTSNINNRAASFVLPDGFRVYGGFQGYESNVYERDFVNNPSILSGEIGTTTPNDNAYHVVKFDNITTEAYLDGFTIEAGYADGASTDNRGGGIFITANNTGNIYLNNNIVQNNYALQGGGLYNAASVSLSNNEIRLNEAAYNGAAIYNWGNTSNLRLETGNRLYNQICNTCFSYLHSGTLGCLYIGPDNSIEY